MITELKSNCMPVSKDGKFSYNILFEDSFADLPEAMADLELETHKICIVTDSNVGPLYAETVKAELEKICSVCEIFTFPAGEENKNLEVVQKLYTFLRR